jgi:hypothetical protein
MLFRALIAIGIVSLLTPHEPDLGLGRPGAGATLPSPASLSSASGLSRMAGVCGNPACAGALAFASLIGLAPKPGRTLDDVKAEIDKDVGARKTAL